jgi:hypothetical protein
MMPIFVGVHPWKELQNRNKLFTALQQCLGIHFVALNDSNTRQLDGAILFGLNPALLDALTARGTKCFLVLQDESDVIPSAPVCRIDFFKSAYLYPAIRGQSLTELTVCANGIPSVQDGDEILASVQTHPVWIVRQMNGETVDVISVEPAELCEGEVLWHQLRRGRFLSLFPLLHFLRKVAGNHGWILPAPRACFIIDDPNLRAFQYGYVDYKKLAALSKEYGFHTSIAFIPIDALSSQSGVVSFFREEKKYLSLTVHGVFHYGAELGRNIAVPNAIGYLQAGIHRIKLFENRYGLRVSRIMVAPHEKISEQFVRALYFTGFEALCIASKPHPWQNTVAHSDISAGKHPATMVCGGIPVFLRDCLSTWAQSGDLRQQDMILKLFLGQPLVIGLHSEDLKGDGIIRLVKLAEFINSLGNVEWMSLEDIARTNFAYRINGSALEVHLFCRRTRIQIPEDIHRVIVQKAAAYPDTVSERIVSNAGDGILDAATDWHCELSVPKDNTLHLSLENNENHRKIIQPPLRVFFKAKIRRHLTEIRDRLKIR